MASPRVDFILPGNLVFHAHASSDITDIGNLYVLKAGDTMTGPLIISKDNTPNVGFFQIFDTTDIGYLLDVGLDSSSAIYFHAGDVSQNTNSTQIMLNDGTASIDLVSLGGIIKLGTAAAYLSIDTSNITANFLSFTNVIIPVLTIGSLTGFLKASSGVVSAQTTIDVSSDTNLAVTSPVVLTGDTLSLLLATNSGLTTSSGLLLGTPSTLTVSTSNSVTTTTHAHAITSSSNPGAAAALLASNSSGQLTLVDLLANTTTFNLINATATTVNFAGAATTITVGATSGTLTLRNTTIVSSQATIVLFNTVATNVSFAGAATTFTMGATSGTLTLRNTTIVSSQATIVLFNTVATNISFGQAATTFAMGANSGTLTIGNPTVVGTQTTQALWNTTATTINFGGAGTAINIGASSGKVLVNGELILGLDLGNNAKLLNYRLVNSDIGADTHMYYGDFTVIAGQSGDVYGHKQNINMSATGNIPNMYALYFNVTKGSSGQVTATMAGAFGLVTNTGTGNIARMIGIGAQTTSIAAATITDAHAFEANVNMATGTVTNYVAFYSAYVNGGANITNAYGLFVEDINGTNKWAIWTSQGVVHFGDRVNAVAGTGTGLAKVGGTIFDHFADATVGGAEADIYTDTVPANTLQTNGDKLIAEYGGTFVTLGTESVQLKAYFGGTAIWDSTGIAVTTGTSSWRVYVEIIRVSATVVRYTVSLNTTGASGFVYAASGELTGLTLSNTNVLKVTGTSSGVGSGSGDIVGKMSYVNWQPVA